MTTAPRSPSLSALILRLWAHLEHPTMDPTTPIQDPTPACDDSADARSERREREDEGQR